MTAAVLAAASTQLLASGAPEPLVASPASGLSILSRLSLSLSLSLCDEPPSSLRNPAAFARARKKLGQKSHSIRRQTRIKKGARTPLLKWSRTWARRGTCSRRSTSSLRQSFRNPSIFFRESISPKESRGSLQPSARVRLLFRSLSIGTSRGCASKKKDRVRSQRTALSLSLSLSLSRERKRLGGLAYLCGEFSRECPPSRGGPIFRRFLPYFRAVCLAGVDDSALCGTPHLARGSFRRTRRSLWIDNTFFRKGSRRVRPRGLGPQDSLERERERERESLSSRSKHASLSTRWHRTRARHVRLKFR